MKKHSFMLLTFSAMLSINAFAPQVFWEKNSIVSRAPATYEFDRLEELAIKKANEKKQKDAQIAKLEADAKQVQCQKDKVSNLEKQMQALLADKALLLSEIDGLKKSKKVKPEEEIEADKKIVKKEKAPKTENTELLSILSQLTSFMYTQQKQQETHMEFMYSLMPSRQQRTNDIRSNYYSPYAFSDGERLSDRFASMPSTDYSLIGRDGHRIGLGTRFNNYSQDQVSGQGMRIPSQVYETHNSQDSQRYSIEPQRPQLPSIHNGYNFNMSMSDLPNFSRTQF